VLLDDRERGESPAPPDTPKPSGPMLAISDATLAGKEIEPALLDELYGADDRKYVDHASLLRSSNSERRCAR
jgi:hypothetical protein